MFVSLMNLLPVVFVALGAMVSLAMEPFLKNENKHKVLPWVAAGSLAFAASSFALAQQDTLYDIFAMDPIRRLLGLTVILCAFLGVCGLQTTLAREQQEGGEPYGG